MITPNKIIGNYMVDQRSVIGRGSFSTVYKGYDGLNRIFVAIKEIDTERLRREHDNKEIDKIMKNISSEINIMKMVHHENIVELKDVIFDCNSVYIVMEYCDYGDIVSYMKKHRVHQNMGLPEAELCTLMLQLANGIKYLYSLGIVHRDLKPQNILLKTDSKTKCVCLKIVDFGFATVLRQGQMTDTVCGSPIYMAPEIIKFQEYSNTSDLWSIGIIMYELITGSPPFVANSVVELCKLYEAYGNLECRENNGISDRMHFLNFSNGRHISNECVDIIMGLLTVSPSKRITWDKFFQHKWFSRKTDIIGGYPTNECLTEELNDDVPWVVIEKQRVKNVQPYSIIDDYFVSEIHIRDTCIIIG